MGLSIGNKDTDALHKSEDNEIHDLPLKATVVAADEIIIEDSADSWAKKRSTLTDLLAATVEAAVLIDAQNESGAPLTKGQVVYVSGESASGKPLVELADADGTGTMSAIGLVHADIADGAEGSIVVAGPLTNVDTSAFLAGDKLYVSTTPGALTNVRPGATSALVQNIGFVTRDHATVGSIAVIGSGRSNDVPNSLTALTGVALGDSDLGTFTGATISDNTDIKNALQELETSVESVSGGALTITTVSSGPTHSATTYNTMYIVTAAAVVEVDLPTAAGNAGKTIDVMATQGATYNVTVDPNGSETINGSSASITLTSDYANVTLVSDGTNWVIR